MRKAIRIFGMITIALLIPIIYQLYHSIEISNESTEMGFVIIKFEEDIINPEMKQFPVSGINSIAIKEVFENENIEYLEAIFKNRYNDNGELIQSKIKNKLNLELWRRVQVKEENIQSFISNLKDLKGVNQIVKEQLIALLPDAEPNDPAFQSNRQWHLNNPGNPVFDINAVNAWDINKGRNDVVIAVLDGGVDYTNVDLDPGDRSRIIAGHDTGDDDNDPMDDLPNASTESFFGHGTHIAGVIGAITNNGSVASGVMWNCKIMPVKMVRSGGIRIPHIYNWDWSESAFPSDVADAIDYAVNNGAHVITMSYSFPSKGWLENEIGLKVPFLREAVENAYQNNVVITSSTGNTSINEIRYPANFNDQVIAVGATDRNGNRRSSSTFGPHIDLVAPGEGIVTVSRSRTADGTTSVSGTSFSTPIVAAIAGLVISHSKDRNIQITNDDVRHILQNTANGNVGLNVGWDIETGHGLVDAFDALQLIDVPNSVIHATSTGGNAIKTVSETPYYIADNRWGPAAGIYYKSDIWTITKHVNFPTAFCSPPEVWMRERESKAISGDNPNDARPFANITNITTTGFDVKYNAAYLRYSSSGQEVNTWIPTHPQNTILAYTAVGEINDADYSGSVSGTSNVCTSNRTYKILNFPAGANISWSKSNNLTYVSGQNTNSYVVKANSTTTSGIGKVIATINTGCSNIVREKEFWVGKPKYSNSFIQKVGTDQYNFTYSNAVQYYTDIADGATSYKWYITSSSTCGSSYDGPVFYSNGGGTTATTSQNKINVNTGTCNGDFYLRCEAQNSCGVVSYSQRLIKVNQSSGGGGGGSCNYSISAFPNPTRGGKVTVNLILPPDDCLYSVLADEKITQNQLIEEISCIEVIDNFGNPVNVEECNLTTSTINLDGYNNGIYYVNATTNIGNTYQVRLLKN